MSALPPHIPIHPVGCHCRRCRQLDVMPGDRGRTRQRLFLALILAIAIALLCAGVAFTLGD